MRPVLILGILSLTFFSGSILFSQNTSEKPPSDESNSNWESIEQSVVKYAEAFNAGKADEIAKLYTQNAELISSGGTVFQGRENIQAEYEAFFKAHPDASIVINVVSLKFVTATVAIEEGETESRLTPDAAPSFSEYVAVHVKADSGWQLASVRDREVQVDAGKNLEELSWLVGRWVDEAPDSLMTIDCYWHESGSYLIRDFEVQVEGLLASSGTERIGWDPLQKKVRSWLHDSDGGFLEGSWVKKGDQWTIATHGFRADGEPTHATYTVTPLREDAYHLAATNRSAGSEELDDFEMTIVKRPPQPGLTQNDEGDAPDTPNEKSEE